MEEFSPGQANQYSGFYITLIEDWKDNNLTFQQVIYGTLIQFGRGKHQKQNSWYTDRDHPFFCSHHLGQKEFLPRELCKSKDRFETEYARS